jgi:hypothetical protein
MSDFGQIVTELRSWVASSDDHVRAAVEMLIAHEHWLRNGHFTRAAVVVVSNGRFIVWSAARKAFDKGEFDRSSTSELAVLDLAIALGENRYRLTSMGSHNRGIIADAVATAVGRGPR